MKYHKIKIFLVFWKGDSLLIMNSDMFFYDFFTLDPKNRVKVRSICSKSKSKADQKFTEEKNS